MTEPVRVCRSARTVVPAGRGDFDAGVGGVDVARQLSKGVQQVTYVVAVGVVVGRAHRAATLFGVGKRGA